MSSSPLFRSERSQLYQSKSQTKSSNHQRWRNSRPTVTVRAGHRERVYRVKPIVTSTIICLFILSALGIMTSSAYLFLRDDLTRANLMKQAKMQQFYEDRISNLRSQVDLATSRQLLEQQVVESRVTKLLLRQHELGALQQQVNRLVKRAGPAKQDEPASLLVPVKPEASTARSGLRLGSLVGTQSPFSGSTANGLGNVELLDSVEVTLAASEKAQIEEIRSLKQRADKKLKQLASILSKQGVQIPSDTGVGGPLIELKSGAALSDSISALDDSLVRLDKLRSVALDVPHGSPTPGKRISSRYGSRKDPFTGRAAVHGGIDFRARRGTPVYATGNGKIVKAGRLGGYGKLVEIDHGHGITTRYAHLSKIKVKVGQRVKKGTRIGNVGSTGRSTGPHLHYEVRRNGRTHNPIKFVRLGKRLSPLL